MYFNNKRMPWSNFHGLNLDWVMETVKANSDKIEALGDIDVYSNFFANANVVNVLAPPNDLEPIDVDAVSANLQIIMDYYENEPVVLFFPYGTYKFDANVIVHGDTKIIGNGSKFIKNALLSRFFINATGTVDYTAYTAPGNIQFIGINFDNNYAEYPEESNTLMFGHSEKILIKDCSFTGVNNFHFVEFNGCQDSIIEGCTFGKMYQDGTRDYTEAVQLDFMGGSPQFSQFGTYDDTVCKNILIRNNKFSRCIAGVGSHSQKTNVNPTGINIINNLFENLEDDAIRFVEYRDSNIAFNTFDTCESMIEMRYSERINILSNVVKNTTSTSIYLQDECKKTLIQGNRIINSATNGVFIEVNCEDVVIKNNIIDGSIGYGIFCKECSNVDIVDNKVLNSGDHGILFSIDANDCRIIGNDVRESGVSSSNIRVSITSDNNVLLNNKVRKGATLTDIGISIGIGCDNTILIGNDTTDGGESLNYEDLGTATVTTSVNIGLV